MKHSLKITLLLLFIFVLAQLNGLFVLDYYINIKESALIGKTVVNEVAYQQSNIIAPEVENESTSYWYIIIALLLGTGLVLLLIKFRQRKLWKLWFFFSVLIALILSLNTWMFRFLNGLFPASSLYIATVLLCLVLTTLKVFRPGIFVHNFTEIFIYGGLAALLVPILNITSMSIVLLLVAVYDMYAVWKSKHMIAMAEFQTEQKVFAGLSIPYQPSAPLKISEYKDKEQKKEKTKEHALKEKTEIRTAILGGGDIAFPLLFAGVVMKTTGSYLAPALIIATTTLALALLFFYGEKGKFYPAIPFIAVGCFLGYGLTFLM